MKFMTLFYVQVYKLKVLSYFAHYWCHSFFRGTILLLNWYYFLGFNGSSF